MGWFRKPRVDPEELERVKEQVRYMREHFDKAQGDRDDVSAQLTDWNKQHDELRTQLATLDERITSVSTELANQLSELGNDIEALNSRSPEGAAPDQERIDQLRSGQERLANEQARYQIAFREDLARLAEQLRRSSR